MDLEAVARGHHGAAARGDGTERKFRPAVECVDLLHLRADAAAVERAFLDHALAAGAAFFGGLEDERHRPRERVACRQARENAGGAEQDGGVAVMPAGVHAVGGARGPGAAAAFLDRECIDVGAQRNGAWAAAGDVCQDAGAARHACHVRDAGVGQLAEHHAAGADFLVADLRMHVEVVADLHQARQLLAHQRADVLGGGMRGVRGGGHRVQGYLRRGGRPHASRPAFILANAPLSWLMRRLSWLMVMPRSAAEPATS